MLGENKQREARLAAEAFEAARAAAVEEHRDQTRARRRKLEALFDGTLQSTTAPSIRSQATRLEGEGEHRLVLMALRELRAHMPMARHKQGLLMFALLFPL